ncbi:hypothetical protein IO90_06310 [Chryseobacterium sp. FH1]|nr:hypothetical protein IO90_06310 [Chryseobacterium sp. FH1]
MAKRSTKPQHSPDGNGILFCDCGKMFDWIAKCLSQSQKRYSGQRVGMLEQKRSRLATTINDR